MVLVTAADLSLALIAATIPLSNNSRNACFAVDGLFQSRIRWTLFLTVVRFSHAL